MSSSPLLKQFESGDNLFFKAIRFLILLSGTLLLCFTGILDLTWPQQAVLGILTIVVAIWLDRSSSSYLVTLTVMLVSMFSTFRYAYWRYASASRFCRLRRWMCRSSSVERAEWAKKLLPG